MEINVVGRHMEVPGRFRRHLEDKLDKIAQLAPDAQRLDAVVSHEGNPRQAGQCDRVELTVHGLGAVIRSEASAEDLNAALDVAYGRLLERLRRVRDRRKDHRRGRERSHGQIPTVRGMAPDIEAAPTAADAEQPSGAETDRSPVVIREKTHRARPMTIDDALYRMELVGHDFFLFIDAGSGRPRVVYRRKGWDYGIIELVEDDRDPAEQEGVAERDTV